MAVKIRLRQQGRKNRQTFRLVATDKRNKRDGKYLEKLGWYDPQMAKDNAKVNEERILFWLEQGAELSLDAKNLLSKSAPNVIKQLNDKVEAKKVKMAAKRRALRKAKAKKTEVKAAAPKAKAKPKSKEKATASNAL